MAPPSTPTPRRFLAPKRPASQSVTPKPLAGGTQQFQATPRFSLASTPRDAGAASAAPSATAPAPSPAVFFSRPRRESISDAIDSSPPPSRRFRDSVEADSLPPSSRAPGSSSNSSSSSSSSSPSADVEPPSPKRRRLTASPAPARNAPSAPSSSPGAGDEADPDFAAPDAADDDYDAWGKPAVGEVAAPPPPPMTQHQPTFRAAPRFRPVADAPGSGGGGSGAREPLPDVFSPRRRGETFVPGGLAAGLRAWLMDLEAATGAKADDEWAARLAVERVRPGGPGLRLVGARALPGDDDDGTPLPLLDEGGDAPAPRAPPRLVVLAGEGRLTGLAGRNEVPVGSVVGVAKPVWEVALGHEGRWVVACDWKVL